MLGNLGLGLGWLWCENGLHYTRNVLQAGALFIVVLRSRVSRVRVTAYCYR